MELHLKIFGNDRIADRGIFNYYLDKYGKYQKVFKHFFDEITFIEKEELWLESRYPYVSNLSIPYDDSYYFTKLFVVDNSIFFYDKDIKILILPGKRSDALYNFLIHEFPDPKEILEQESELPHEIIRIISEYTSAELPANISLNPGCSFCCVGFRLSERKGITTYFSIEPLYN